MLTFTDRQFVREHFNDDLHRLLLSAHRYPGIQMPLVVEQIEAFRKVQTKIPSWFRFDLELPAPLSVEQASSERTARFKAGLFAGKTMADLSGGMGVDTFFFAERFEQVFYVEPNQDLVRLARRNFAVLGAVNIRCFQDKAADFLANYRGSFDFLYLDPSRRDDLNRRVFRLEDCQPNVLELKKNFLIKAGVMLLKTAPLLDLQQVVEELRMVTGVWVVSVDNECKEVLYRLESMVFGLPDKWERRYPIEAVCLGRETRIFRFTREEELAAVPEYSVPRKFLYEPDAAVLKAGAFKLFATRNGLAKLHPNTHLYTSEALAPGLPARSFAIEAVLPYQRKAVNALIPEGRANITVRNFPDPVAQVRKKLGLRDGGDWYLFGAIDTTDRPVLIACRQLLDKVDANSSSLHA